MLFTLWKFKEQKLKKNHRWNETKFKSLKPEIYKTLFCITKTKTQRERMRDCTFGVPLLNVTDPVKHSPVL